MILTEVTTSRPTIISEQNQSGQLKISLELLECDKKGQNRRIYPLDDFKKSVDRIQNKVKNRQLIGELDHPVGEERQQLVYIKESSHLISDIKFNGNLVVGVFEIFPNDNGRKVTELINCNVQLGTSLRQAGELYPSNDNTFIAKNVEIITWDIVSNPSYDITYFTRESIIESLRYVLSDKQHKLYDKKQWNKYKDRLIDIVTFNLMESLKLKHTEENIKMINEQVIREMDTLLNVEGSNYGRRK